MNLVALLGHYEYQAAIFAEQCLPKTGCYKNQNYQRTNNLVVDYANTYPARLREKKEARTARSYKNYPFD